MTIKRFFLALFMFSLAPYSVGYAEASPSAKDLIDRSAEALGGHDVIEGLSGVRLTVLGSGISPSATQARSPIATHNVTQQERTYHIDTRGQRAKRESSQISPGQIRFHTLAIATADGARTVDLLMWRSGTDIQNQPAAVGKEAFTAWARLLPHTALKQALGSAATLQLAADVERDGRTLDAVTFDDPVGTKVTLLLEKESGVVFSASPGEFPGSAYEFGDYKLQNGVLEPQRLTVQSSQLLEELRYTAIDLRYPAREGDFMLPSGYSDPPPLGDPRAVKVAPAVYRLDGMPANYHSAFIVDGTEVTVFDAPQSAEWSEKVLAVIRGVVGENARVVRVLISHHHGDHTNGLSMYVANGATIVCGAGTAEFLRSRLPEAQRATAKFEEVAESKSFGKGASRIEAHAVPNEHADGMLAFYLPAAKILLQGDLFYVPERGVVPPAFPVSADLERVLEMKKLNVQTIIGIHGRQSTISELRRSLELRSSPR